MIGYVWSEHKYSPDLTPSLYFINTIELVVFGNELIRKQEVGSLKAVVVRSNVPSPSLPWQIDKSSKNAMRAHSQSMGYAGFHML